MLAYLKFGPYDRSVHEVRPGADRHLIAGGDFSKRSTYRRAQPAQTVELEQTQYVVYVWDPHPAAG